MADCAVILPALNENGAIAQVLADLRALPLFLEIIVVDDASTDGTGALAREAGATVVRHERRLGAGRSVKDGVGRASCDIVVMIDADGTYPIDRIPDLLAALEDCDLVVGARRGKNYHGSPAKYVARQIFRLVAQTLTGKSIPDVNSGMRAFRKSTMQPYFPYLCEGFSLPTTMTLACFFTGKAVRYIPIDYHARIGSSKVQIIRDAIKTLGYMAGSFTRFRIMGLKIDAPSERVVVASVSVPQSVAAPSSPSLSTRPGV